MLLGYRGGGLLPEAHGDSGDTCSLLMIRAEEKGSTSYSTDGLKG